MFVHEKRIILIHQHLASSSISCRLSLLFFISSRPPQPQARRASLSISMSPMGRWTRWCPTCLGEPRRTEASWGEPRRRGICCGRSWNADLPLGSFSTDQRTENMEEETKRRGCQRVEIFFFFIFPGWRLLLWLSALSLPRCRSPVPACSGDFFLLMDLFGVSLSFFLCFVLPPSFLPWTAHVLSITFLYPPLHP